MIKVRTEVRNMGEVLQQLGAISPSGEEMLPVLQQHAAPMVAALRANTPQNTGKLRESIGLIERNKSRAASKMRAGVIIGARNYGAFRGMGSAAHLVEFGTAERVMKLGLRAGGITRGTNEPYSGHGAFTPKAGKSTGRVQARRFMQRTFDENQEAVGRQIVSAFEELLKQKLKLK